MNSTSRCISSSSPKYQMGSFGQLLPLKEAGIYFSHILGEGIVGYESWRDAQFRTKEDPDEIHTSEVGRLSMKTMHRLRGYSNKRILDALVDRVVALYPDAIEMHTRHNNSAQVITLEVTHKGKWLPYPTMEGKFRVQRTGHTCSEQQLPPHIQVMQGSHSANRRTHFHGFRSR